MDSYENTYNVYAVSKIRSWSVFPTIEYLHKFVKLLAAGLSENFGVTYGNMANYTKIRIQMRVLRAASMCIRGIKKV